MAGLGTTREPLEVEAFLPAGVAGEEVAVSAWTREEAAVQLHLCSAGKHWVTTPTCDSCAMNEHRCPPTLAEINELVQDAQRLAIMVEKVRTEVRKAADGRLS